MHWATLLLTTLTCSSISGRNQNTVAQILTVISQALNEMNQQSLGTAVASQILEIINLNDLFC